MPAMNSLMAKRVPVAWRSSALGLVYAGFHAGLPSAWDCGVLIDPGHCPSALQAVMSDDGSVAPALHMTPSHLQAQLVYLQVCLHTSQRRNALQMDP